MASGFFQDKGNITPDLDKKSSITEVFAGASADAVLTNTNKDSLKIDKKDTFWIKPDIEKLNWNKAFPYQLLVVAKSNDGKYVTQTDLVFTLPISPESLQISTPYAISVQATQGGIIEEHNSAPFRMINIGGTTGILPLRGNSGANASFGPLQSIFAGTANAGQQLVSSLKKIAGIQNAPNVVKDSDISSGDTGKSTGYFQFHALNYFLERYTAFKKTKDGRDFVLAFAMWKDKHVYLVTPQAFNLSRVAGSPFEYTYSLSLKAWKRVVLNTQGGNAYNYVPAGRSQGVMGRILQTALQARESLSALTNTFKAIGADLDRSIMEPLRQTILFAKDLLGIPRAMADIPQELTKSAAGAVVLYLTTKENFDDFASSNGNGSFSKELNDMVTIARGVAEVGKEAGSGDYNSTTAVATLDRLFAKDQSYDDFSTGRVIGPYVSPAMRIFNDPSKYMRLFEKIPVSALQLHTGLSNQINQDAVNIKNIYNRSYAEKMRDQAVAFLASFENAIGAGNLTYQSTYQNGPNSNNIVPTDQDFDAIYALNLYIQSLNELAVSDDINQVRIDPTAYVAGLASKSGIAFVTPVSKFSVPFPYRGTLEELANIYLGSQDRWIEIADLNGLVPPYVDETGFDLPLIINANNDRVSVSDSTNLYVGQSVSIVSTAKSKTTRKILRIDKIPNAFSIIFLDGDPDLFGYNVDDGAILHASLPNTVNSQMSIYIPSNIEPEYDDFLFKAIPGVDTLDRLFRVAGTDLLLDSNMDLIVTPDGDSPLALGLNAIIQDLKIKVLTKKGSILRHRNFGLPLAIGDSLADISAKSIVSSIKEAFINDSTYTGVRYAKVEIKGPVTTLNFAVGIRGVADFIPVTVSLPQQ